MMSKFSAALLLAAAVLAAASAGAGNLWPPREYDQGVIAEWNAMLVNAAPASVGDNMPRYYVLMHTAMYDAIASIDRKGTALHSRVPAPHHASTDAAAAQAAHDVLVALFPRNKPDFDFELKRRLATINPERARLGVEVGREVAKLVLAWGAP
jgi:hypothetical protein